MNKLEGNELKKLELYSKNQINALIKSKNDLEAYAYPCVSAKELLIIDKVLTKIKNYIQEHQPEEEITDGID